jgi:hypothetical protein
MEGKDMGKCKARGPLLGKIKKLKETLMESHKAKIRNIISPKFRKDNFPYKIGTLMEKQARKSSHEKLVTVLWESMLVTRSLLPWRIPLKIVSVAWQGP